ALIAALRHPERVRALALYEPTLFAVVDAEKAPPNGADGIRNTVAASGTALDAGDREGAARLFIDFWMGDGSWNRMPSLRGHAIPAAVAHPEVDEQASGAFAISGVQGSSRCRDRVADAISAVRGCLLGIHDGEEGRLVQRERTNPLGMPKRRDEG